MAFDFDFNVDKFTRCVPSAKNPADWFRALDEYLPQYEITNIERVGMFLAQCSHESGGFTVLQENLNYRAERLLQVFPKYFRGVDIHDYEHNPQAIANRVYANRMGNGDEDSGDGWRYHGRGLIQLTGKDNYSRCSKEAWEDDTLLDDPDELSTINGAVLSACWFWDDRGINGPSDRGDIAKVTKLINGGYTGLDDRTTRYHRIMPILQS